MLHANADRFADPATPLGCMERRQEMHGAILLRLRRGITEGDLPPATDAAALATYSMTVLQGMALSSRDGATRAQLQAVVDCAMTAL